MARDEAVLTAGIAANPPLICERDLRMLNIQRQVSGGFHSTVGVGACTRIRGDLSTLAKQGGHLLAALAPVFIGSPLDPALGWIVTSMRHNA